MLRLTSGERKRSALASPRLSSTLLGHSLQAVSILVHAAASLFAVPLAIRIHEGLVWTNRDRRTLLDKMLALLGIVAITEPCYFVADAYYAAHKIVAGLLRQNNHLVTRMKSNAVAYTAHHQRGPRKRGRPRIYGRKIKLRSLLDDPKSFQHAPSPVYGENKVIIQYRVRDLLWRPAGRLVRFVAVIHPARGACLLMCTDTSLDAIDIIRLYGMRFKIEHTFKQAVRQIGAFTYHFWMSDMRPLRRNNGNQHLHRASLKYRKSSGASFTPTTSSSRQGSSVRDCFSTSPSPSLSSSGAPWVPGSAPFVPVFPPPNSSSLPRYAEAAHYPNADQNNIFTKFVVERQDTNKMQAFRLAA